MSEQWCVEGWTAEEIAEEDAANVESLMRSLAFSREEAEAIVRDVNMLTRGRYDET